MTQNLFYNKAMTGVKPINTDAKYCFGSTRSQVRILSPRLESQRIAKAVAPIMRRLLKAVYVCPDPLPRKGLARIGVGCRFRSSEVLSPREIDSPSNSFHLLGIKRK